MNKRTTEQANIISDHATPHPTKSAQNITTKQRGMSYRSCNVRKTTYHHTIDNMYEPRQPSAKPNHHQRARTTISHHHANITTARYNTTQAIAHGVTAQDATIQSNRATEQAYQISHTYTHTHTHTHTHTLIPHSHSTIPL